EALSNQELIQENYQGIRPAPGYPACPDHAGKGDLWRLLNPTSNAGIELTENWAMHPGAAVSGWYFWRPESHYFGVGKIGRAQVEGYAARRGWHLPTPEHWLASSLGYQRAR